MSEKTATFEEFLLNYNALRRLTNSTFVDSKERQKQQVWEKGKIINGKDPFIYRMDDYGKIIQYSEHGNRQSPYGWEIDHIIPQALDGSDSLSNLRLLHFRRNAQFGASLGQMLRHR